MLSRTKSPPGPFSGSKAPPTFESTPDPQHCHRQTWAILSLVGKITRLDCLCPSRSCQFIELGLTLRQASNGEMIHIQQLWVCIHNFSSIKTSMQDSFLASQHQAELWILADKLLPSRPSNCGFGRAILVLLQSYLPARPLVVRMVQSPSNL